MNFNFGLIAEAEIAAEPGIEIMAEFRPKSLFGRPLVKVTHFGVCLSGDLRF